MKKSSILYLIFFIFCSFSLKAQKAEVLSANKKYESYAYIDAIKSYERIVENGYKSADLYQKLGNSYFFNAELDKAAKWYKALIELKADVDPEYYFRYANCLRSIGKLAEANKMLEIYNKKSTSNKGALYIKDVNYLDKIEANSNRYKIKDAGINTRYSDYGSAFYGDSLLVFTSARDTNGLVKKKHTWTNQAFTQLYKVKLTDSTFNTGQPTNFSIKSPARINEASAVFTKDGNTMYFTRNNFINGKKGEDKHHTTLIKLYRATLVNGDWKEIVELPFNSDEYSTAHPALSPDQKTLYFVSDMPGTLGNSDIFKVAIQTDGTYGTPINLGAIINTPGRETFPWLSDENEMYFSSDTHSGLGGLDVFVAKIDDKGTFEEVQNLGRDINSPRDDFAYLINTKTRYGFFSSNRERGNGYDDIYQFFETKRLSPILCGYITDLATGLILPNAKVILYNDLHQPLDSAFADKEGYYEFKVKNSKTYTVTAQKEEYNTNGKTITIPKYELKNRLDIPLEKSKCKIVVGTDLAKCFGITMIYFDLDKSNIRPDAAVDLSKILDVLREFPTLKIDIRSHTDSRASFKYNEALSDRRAKSTRTWLIKQGIDPGRLTAKGFGEYRLVNRCADDVPCSEEEHQQNRRSEFIVVSI